MAQPEMTQYSEIWTNIRVRYFVIVCFLPLFYVPGFGYVLSQLGPDAPDFKIDLAYVLYWQTILILVAYVTATLPVEVPLRKMLGRTPNRNELLGGLKLTAYLYVLSIGAAYLLFLPLSYWVPTFVTLWFIEYPDLVIYHNDSYPIAPNLLDRKRPRR